MEVELDVPPQAGGWRQWWREEKEFCQRLWLCRSDKLFKDEPMTPADWDAHLSWRRHCPEPRVFARVFKMLSVVELWVLSVTVGAGLYATYLQKRPGWPALCSRDYMIVFNITSFALALLMVFRTNTAHARWWEARTASGRWLNVVRNTQRMMLTWATAPGDAPVLSEFTRWVACLTAAACAYLCRKDSYWEHCEGLLTPEEVAWLSACDNAPVKVLMILTGLVKRSSLSELERLEVERELSAFDIALGALERITRQAIPMAYSRHTSRFIIAYLTFLPFALFDYLGWMLLPAMVALTFLLVGIENIGVQIENPVRVLPMHRFCVGNRTAALSLAQHFESVDARLAAGLAAAAAGGGPRPAAAWGKGGGAAQVVAMAAPPVAPMRR